MNKDIRLSTNMVNHAKVKKMMRKLGPESFYSFVSLLSYVAINKPNGELTGMDETDIAIAANWDGDEGVFCQTICDLGFIDQYKDGRIFIHNWVKHNPFAFGATDRSLVGRKNQFMRWAKEALPENKLESFKKWLNEIAVIHENTSTVLLLNEYDSYTKAIQHTIGNSTNGNTPYPLPPPTPTPEPPPTPEPALLLTSQGEELNIEEPTVYDPEFPFGQGD